VPFLIKRRNRRDDRELHRRRSEPGTNDTDKRASFCAPCCTNGTAAVLVGDRKYVGPGQIINAHRFIFDSLLGTRGRRRTDGHPQTTEGAGGAGPSQLHQCVARAGDPAIIGDEGDQRGGFKAGAPVAGRPSTPPEPLGTRRGVKARSGSLKPRWAQFRRGWQMVRGRSLGPLSSLGSYCRCMLALGTGP